MSSPLPPATSTGSATGPRLSVAALLDRATRLATMLIIVAFGLMLLATFREILRESPIASVEKGTRVVGAAPQESQFARAQTTPDFSVLQPGVWSLGDSTWTLSQRQLSSPADQERLHSLGSRTTAEAKPSSLEEKLLVWLRRLRPTVVNGCRVYDTSLRGSRVRLVTEQRAGQERLRLAQLVWTKDRFVQLLELAPAPDAGTGKADAGHLLPLPAGVASLGRRWDKSGRLSCEILGPATTKDCLREWSAAGWTAEKIVGEQGPMSLVLLRKEDRVIQLASVEAGPSGSPAYLLLMVQSAKQ